jgi:hypothetical protein
MSMTHVDENNRSHLQSITIDKLETISLISSSSSSSPTYQSLWTGDVIDYFHQHVSYSFLFCIEENTVLHFMNRNSDKITMHLVPAELIIWSGRR